MLDLRLVGLSKASDEVLQNRRLGRVRASRIWIRSWPFDRSAQQFLQSFTNFPFVSPVMSPGTAYVVPFATMRSRTCS